MGIQYQLETLQVYGTDNDRLVRLVNPDVPEQFAHHLRENRLIANVLQQAAKKERKADMKDALLCVLECEAAKSINSQQRDTHPIRVIEERKEGSLGVIICLKRSL